MAFSGNYLKKHTEALVKSVGIEGACALTGKSKATLGRYYSDYPEHQDRFMPIDTVIELEKEAKYPFVTAAMAELHNVSLKRDGRPTRFDREGSLSADVIAMSQRFALLIGEYQEAVADNIITATEAKRLLAETSKLQQILIDMKLHLGTDGD